MKKMIMILLVVVILVFFGLLVCGSNNVEEKMEGEKMEVMDEKLDMNVMEEEKMEEEGVMVGGVMMVLLKDIVDNVVNFKDYIMLVFVVKVVGLVEILKGEGLFIVFVFMNEVFVKLFKKVVEDLMKLENKVKFMKVFMYYVVLGVLKFLDLKDGQMLKIVEGEELKVMYKDGVWKVNGVWIVIVDVIFSNGVMYVIDEVLMFKKM